MRFFLIGKALGNTDFRLGSEFRKELGSAFGLEIPEDAFAAMDYHLDWIGASLFLVEDAGRESQVHTNAAGLVEGTQRDVDLIVAFADSRVTHLIMLEAKAYGDWDSGQMTAKTMRLAQIFGPHGDAVPNVEPHFGVTSPDPPNRLKTDRWPRWMLSASGTPTRLELHVPSDRSEVTRSDSNGQSAEGGGYFVVTTRFGKEAREPGTRNYDYRLALGEALELCLLQPDIEVGHGGGEGGVRKMDMTDARRKRWKLRHPKTNRGKALPENWIAGNRFLDLIAEMRE